MGRCQSTPGLVESCGRTTCEDMWLPSYPHQIKENITHNLALSPNSNRTDGERTINSVVESTGSISPSASDDRQRSSVGFHLSSRKLSQPSRLGYISDSNTQLERYCTEASGIGEGTTPLLGSHEALEDEIKRLRERLHTVESENQALNKKLSQQQWDVENRLAEIEMQICGVSSTSSADPEVDSEEMERNRESII